MVWDGRKEEEDKEPAVEAEAKDEEEEEEEEGTRAPPEAPVLAAPVATAAA